MSQHAPVIHGQPAPPPAVAMVPRPPSPVFVAVPPRSQRLLHSETYLRYIEGLTPTNQSVSNWRRAVQQAPVGPLRDSAAVRLPTQWLGTSAMHHNSATEALWALRDLMLKDTVNIVKYNDL
jgi:protein polybromo-1